jgi:hypothetical protein
MLTKAGNDDDATCAAETGRKPATENAPRARPKRGHAHFFGPNRPAGCVHARPPIGSCMPAARAKPNKTNACMWWGCGRQPKNTVMPTRAGRLCVAGGASHVFSVTAPSICFAVCSLYINLCIEQPNAQNKIKRNVGKLIAWPVVW